MHYCVDMPGKLPYNIKMLMYSRMDIRVSPDVKAQVQRAADMSGRTLTDFVTAAAVQAASETLERCERMVLSAKDSLQLIEALDKFTPPNEAMQRAFARHDKHFYPFNG